MSSILELIYKFEVGNHRRKVVYLLLLLAIALLAVAYDYRCFRNMSTPEAMDSAQLARNIAEGNGYTTSCIRPLSMYLVSQANGSASPDAARLKGPHPDLANPPVYPVMLAGLMKLGVFEYHIPTRNEQQKPFWSDFGQFSRYQPDFVIAIFNQVMFLLLLVMVFFWAERMFDARVAWTSTFLLLGTELLWRFSVSGLSTMLLLLIFMALVWNLTLWESEAREPKHAKSLLVTLSIAAGLLVGLGGLTRYAFAWLIIPVAVFFVVFSPSRRWLPPLLAFMTFAVVMTPWIVRNYSVSGTPFGTATYTVMENTAVFSDYRLQRSLELNFGGITTMKLVALKLLSNSRSILEQEIPRLGGGWIGPFFIVGLLVAFRSAALRRLRYFVLLTLGLLIIVQALGRTHLSDMSPEISSENLLVLVLPVILVYGVSLFYTLIDQTKVHFRYWRRIAIGLFGIALCFPLIFALLPPQRSPVSFPPYNPPFLQQASSWMGKDELMMSDVPWAVAWYGGHKCLWLTLTPAQFVAIKENEGLSFTANLTLSPSPMINSDQKTAVKGIFLTPETTDTRMLQWMSSSEMSWGHIVMVAVANQMPRDFPLREVFGDRTSGQLFLSDRKRWLKSE